MTLRTRSPLRLERLEARDVPTVLFNYLDVDGDHVRITSSLPKTLPNTASLASAANVTAGGQLQRLNLSPAVFANTNITITVVGVPVGDGLVNVGYIDSTGHNIGKVTVKGDLGQIDAGSNTIGTPAIKSLAVRSMGRLGTDTQAAGGSLQSDIKGALGALVVSGDVVNAQVVTVGTDGNIGPVTIGGSLIGTDGGFHSGLILATNASIGMVKIGGNIEGGNGPGSGQVSAGGTIGGVSVGGGVFGGSGDYSGYINSSGDMGAVKIGHDVRGGSGSSSGAIQSANGKFAGLSIGGSLVGGLGGLSGSTNSGSEMGPVKIGHDLIGGSGGSSGLIASSRKLAGLTIVGSLIGGGGGGSGAIINATGGMGLLRIGHDLIGGSGTYSGYILSAAVSAAKLDGLTIGGSLIGGTGDNSGEIFSGDIGPLRIAHDLLGGSIGGTTGTLSMSGGIQSYGRIASVFIGGSIVAGIDTSTAGNLVNNASIRSKYDIGSLTVRGSLIGNTNPDGVSPVIISAGGRQFLVLGRDLAMGKVMIGGRVENARILAGYDVNLVPQNADAQIGAVTVGGNWVASSIAAGVADGGDGFGNIGDARIVGGSDAIRSEIASITIGGQVYGTPAASGADNFGFVAQRIGSFKAHGYVALLTDGQDAIGLPIISGDVTIREVF